MKSTKISVTIGIPVFNEEQNIVQLIDRILEQDQNGFVLNKIIIVSDCSTDLTDQLVLKIKNNKVILLRNKQRYGQIYSQSKIFALANSSVVVLLEGDTIPSNKKYLSTLLRPFITGNIKEGLIQGNELPLAPKTFLEKVLYKQFTIFYHKIVQNKSTNTWLTSGRGGRAFSKKIYKKLRWPTHVPEDVYAMLWSKKNMYTTLFQLDAVCYFQLPQTIPDFIKERKKVNAGEESLRKYFSQELIGKIYKRNILLIVLCFFIFLIRYPLEFMCYFLLHLSIIFIPKTKFFDQWQVTHSTKKINVNKITPRITT